jgi:2-iminoacetate synthase ThiH
MMLSVLSHGPSSSLSGLYRFLPWIVRNISESKVRILEKWVEVLASCAASDGRGQSVRDEENRDYRRRSYQDPMRPKARV